MDDMLSKAVKEAFVRMHADCLVYRDNRLVNWCCRLKTAISDIEVDHIDVEGSTEMTRRSAQLLLDKAALLPAELA